MLLACVHVLQVDVYRLCAVDFHCFRNLSSCSVSAGRQEADRHRGTRSSL